MSMSMDNIQFENKNIFQNEELNLNMGRHNQFNNFSKNLINAGDQEEQKPKFKNNMNDNDLFSLTKENFYNTSSTFYFKDNFNNDNFNKGNQMNINNNNLDKIFNNRISLDKKSKSEIDIKYNYYLANLNNERNNENDNIIQKNEHIQKLLEEEKNIEEENLKRLTELRVKYLSSIKTFDVPLDENNKTNNTKENLKARTERRVLINNDINEYYNNINGKNKNSSSSLGNKLFKENNSLNDIIKSPINLKNDSNNNLINDEENLVKNNYTSYISNILSMNDIVKSNFESINNTSQNKIINKIGSISNQSLNDDFETIGKKSDNEKENYIQNNLKEIKKDIKEGIINNSYNIDNTNIFKDQKSNKSINDGFNEKNDSKLYNTEQNIHLNNDNDFYFKYDDSIDEKRKIVGRNNISENKFIKKTKIIDNINNKDYKTDYSVKKVKICENSEKLPLNGNCKKEEFNKKELFNNKDELIHNYKILEFNYNNLIQEYSSLKNEYLHLLDNYNKEKNEIKIKDEKSLYNNYFLQENNDLKKIISNYEYILTPLINYINDISYLINKQKLKKIDIAKINQKIRNIKDIPNQNDDFFKNDEHPLYSFVQLLDNYKNIIYEEEIFHSTNKKSKSNPKKLNDYETIMKNYNIKDKIIFKFKNNNKDSFSKSLVSTPIYSKNSKNHQIFRGKISKTEKFQNKSKGKMAEKRKQIIGKNNKKVYSSINKKTK